MTDMRNFFENHFKGRFSNVRILYLKSQGGAAFGSCSGSHHPSSLPSKQSGCPSQNNWVFRQVPSPQAVSSGGQIGSFVLRSGFGVVSSAVTSQL